MIRVALIGLQHINPHGSTLTEIQSFMVSKFNLENDAIPLSEVIDALRSILSNEGRCGPNQKIVKISGASDATTRYDIDGLGTLKDHLRRSMDPYLPRRFVCPRCNKRIISYVRLQRHWERFHIPKSEE